MDGHFLDVGVEMLIERAIEGKFRSKVREIRMLLVKPECMRIHDLAIIAHNVESGILRNNTESGIASTTEIWK